MNYGVQNQTFYIFIDLVCTYYMLNTKEHFNKFYFKALICILLRYSEDFRAYSLKNTQAIVI